MDSHQHTRKAHVITDIYFYEELSKIIGCDASYEWLQTNAVRRGKSVSISLSASSQSSKQSSPQNSAATTPRRLSLIQPCPKFINADHQETFDQQASSRKSDETVVLSITLRSDLLEVRPPTKQQSSNAPMREAAPHDAESAMHGRIGLLYTDAAHSVLEDQGVADYIEHAIGRPHP
uniref:Uncharacterized protein n=1 Tax=Cryptomonas curvata TaxID=233186 RepID=A0A7S0MW19_9CRYP|mmetsp:Transcript_5464/g.12166  ORF Transcript_5464/g.12166 Transcript_5464/m.12166 type:complete len:177 (+) Transcript_5464:46-576(+)